MAKAAVTDEAPLTQTLLVNFYVLLRQWPTTTILLLLALRFLIRRYLSPLRKYPGPFLASGTRLYSLILTARGRTHEDHVALHRKYGSIVRIQPNQLSFSSPEAARQILSPGKGFHKTNFYWVFPPYNNPDIFTEVRENVHATKKRFVNQPYSLASFQALAPWIDQTIKVLTRKLDFYAERSTKTIDLGNFLHWFAFDVLGEAAFSSSFGFVEQERDVDGAIKFIDTVQQYDGIVGQIPFLDYLLRRSPYWDYLPFVSPLTNNYITRTALGQMTAREDGTAVVGRRDLLSQLFEAHEKDPEKFDKGSVFAVAHGAIFAGSDSTASTMQTFMWNVLNNKAVYDKLTEEILAADRNGDLGEIVTWEESQKCLPYFQACLKEAMRVGPAVGLAIYRKVPGAGTEIDGVFVPGGTELAVNAHVLHKDQAIFGQDADVFRPERWLVKEGDEKGEARIKAMDRHMFQFGGGAHVCIGRNLAILEMNKVLPQILRRYKFELNYPGRPMKKHSTFFVVQEGLEVSIEKR
ncbi:hypothetical protein PMZ80_008520 [Knufia obscura]|uniref:Cytochrome P450 n=2 Tax=Knufia TaxID=430999 RepID=A0AAN8EQR7_9EURO|nr:hypothetical protein PMZ80_008520 [Knufia obscura]KAK5951976.1 hypothetical protein OHC33_006862 [Knufia fluminis]